LQPDQGEIQRVVEAFWAQRDNVAQTFSDNGVTGVAPTVTGRHMEAIQNFVRDLFIRGGLPTDAVLPKSPSVPGYFRRSKSWDIVAVYKDALVGAIELKSQVGSVGNNANNRIEEALGNAVDITTAHKVQGTFGALPPWTAFVMVLEETEATERPISAVRTSLPFPIDAEFERATYSKQYQIAISRFISEKLYDAGWFITTKRDSQTGAISFQEPLPTATAKTLASAIQGRIAFVRSALD
jgi:hypothetical protein